MMILFWLTIKHFICDFPLQMTPFMYLNKGKYGHPGGIIHAAIHGVGTLIVMYLFLIPPFYALVIAFIDFVLHYHIDWAKVNINTRWNLKPDNSQWYWFWLGVDQLLHMLTYFGLVWVIYQTLYT